MVKKRTQNKFENAAISGVRLAFSRYSPKYGEVWEKARVELEKPPLKDGSPAKTKAVRRWCAKCGFLEKNEKADVDHKIPVIPIGKTRHDFTLGEYIDMVDCDISNLWVLCEKCHNFKSAIEREERKKFKNKLKSEKK